MLLLVHHEPSLSAVSRGFPLELALTLFVAWVSADHHDTAMAANNLAVIADPLHAWLNLHGSSLSVVAYLLTYSGRRYGLVRGRTG